MTVAETISLGARDAPDRISMWTNLIDIMGYESGAEIGVFEGEFSRSLLARCPKVSRYYMIDPWRHLDDWNKPLNRSDGELDAAYRQALTATEFASERRTVWRGTTTEVIDRIPEHGIDFAYVDGDHTLKGITIDLISIWPKIREGGLIAGDDFSSTAWQHNRSFEPTLVFPFAVYFAQAMNTVVYGLPHDQYAITVDRSPGRAFEFRDLTGGRYARTDLLGVLGIRGGMRSLMRRALQKVR